MTKNKFQFLTYGGFHIETSRGYHILIDPYLDGNKHIDMNSDDFEHIDLILVSHGPFNHVGDTVKLAIKHGCPVICPDDVKWHIIEEGVPASQINAMCWGMVSEYGGIRIKAIENHHRSVIKLRKGDFVSCTPLCFIITLEDGTRVYNAGDTSIFSDMKLQAELYGPHIGLINVSGDPELSPSIHRHICAEMSPYEAALASHWLGVEVVVCCHYVTRDDPNLAEYLSIMDGMKANKTSPVKTIALEPGGTYEYAAQIL